MMKTPRAHSKSHLDFIRGLSCLVCLDNTTTEAAHIRFPDPTAGKRQTGMGEKPHDCFTIPLCGKHHREQHAGAEKAFWRHFYIDPIRIALALWANTGNHELGEQIVSLAHD